MSKPKIGCDKKNKVLHFTICNIFLTSSFRDFSVLKIYFQTMEVRETRMFKETYFDFAGKVKETRINQSWI